MHKFWILKNSRINKHVVPWEWVRAMLENISKQDEYCMECEYNRERDFEFETPDLNLEDEELYYTPYCFLREQEVIKAIGKRNFVKSRKYMIMSNFNHEEFQYPVDCPYTLERMMK